MSRSAQITITVTEYDESKADAIDDAVVDLNYEGNPNVFLAGKPNRLMVFDSEVIEISGGHSDDEVATEIHEAIWKANGEFCNINVSIMDLGQEIPCYEGDEAAYDEWLSKMSGPSPT